MVLGLACQTCRASSIEPRSRDCPVRPPAVDNFRRFGREGAFTAIAFPGFGIWGVEELVEDYVL